MMDRQYLLTIIEDIHTSKGRYPGKKELQKIVYLLQSKGVALGYPYRFYFYGPYSDALDEDIKRLAIQGSLAIEYEETTHRIGVSKSASADSDMPDRDLVRAIIDEIRDETPVQLELMTTILFIIDNDLLPDDYNEGDVIDKVRELKGKKYSEDMIADYYRNLISMKYIMS